MRKTILPAVLVTVLAVIILTWGSVGSAALTLGLILSGIYLAADHFRKTHDPDDLFWEE